MVERGAAYPRKMWERLETIHAVTYFAPESTDATSTAGVMGFWRTYFGFRASPCGPCSAEAVTAMFFGFSPRMVGRAVPDVWDRLDPSQYVALRGAAAATALRRLVPSIEEVARGVEVRSLLLPCATLAPAGGRPLYAGNRAVQYDDPVAQLWQACTALREHRGDGHVASLVAAALSPPEAMILFAASTRTPEAVMQDNRGWSDAEWTDARAQLRERRLLDDHGITAGGEALRGEIEAATDRSAEAPYDGLDARDQQLLLDALTPTALTLAASGLIPFPNPMGLARVGSP